MNFDTFIKELKEELTNISRSYPNVFRAIDQLAQKYKDSQQNKTEVIAKDFSSKSIDETDYTGSADKPQERNKSFWSGTVKTDYDGNSLTSVDNSPVDLNSKEKDNSKQ